MKITVEEFHALDIVLDKIADASYPLAGIENYSKEELTRFTQMKDIVKAWETIGKSYQELYAIQIENRHLINTD